MVIRDTPEKLKPNTGFSAAATWNNYLGERKLAKLELFSEDKNIVLDEQECKAVMEAVMLKGSILSSFETRGDYFPYREMSFSLDGKGAAYMNMYDEDTVKPEIVK